MEEIPQLQDKVLPCSCPHLGPHKSFSDPRSALSICSKSSLTYIPLPSSRSTPLPARGFPPLPPVLFSSPRNGLSPQWCNPSHRYQTRKVRQVSTLVPTPVNCLGPQLGSTSLRRIPRLCWGLGRDLVPCFSVTSILLNPVTAFWSLTYSTSPLHATLLKTLCSISC